MTCHWLIALGFSMLTLAAQAVEPETAHLQVRVVDREGRPLSRVAAIVRGPDADSIEHVSTASTAVRVPLGDPARILRGGLLGRFDLDLPPAVYDIAFTRLGYYDLELRGVEIEIPDSPRRIDRLEPLRVMMQPRRDLTAEPESATPLVVHPPSLEISFRTTKPPVRSIAASGLVTFTNVGETPMLLPLEQDFEWQPDRTLVVRLMLEIEGTDVAFDEYFGCGSLRLDRSVTPRRPVFQRCRRLAPGESAEVPVRLSSKLGYSVGLSRPAIWGDSGSYEGRVAASFIQPHSEDGAPPVSREIESAFELTIRGWK